MINKLKQSYKFPVRKRLLGIFLSVFVTIIILAIFQDFLHSKRNGYSFFFLESLLFKSFWLFFPPILLLLKHVLQSRQTNTLAQMGLAVIFATLAHLLLVPLTIWCLSAIFRDQSYGRRQRHGGGAPFGKCARPGGGDHRQGLPQHRPG